jgi:hypothetical protein
MNAWFRDNVDLLAVVLLGFVLASEPAKRDPAEFLRLSWNPGCLADVLVNQQVAVPDLQLPDWQM